MTSCMVDGDPASPILVVGESPGREELRANRPFIGASGRILWGQLGRAGVDRSQCYIINVIGEMPERKTGGPTVAQIERYWDQFEQYLGQSQAKVILCLGGAAFDRVTGIIDHEKKIKSLTGSRRETGIMAWRGYLVTPGECRPRKRTVERWGVYKTSRKGKYTKGDPKLERHTEMVPPTLPAALEWIVPTIHPAAVMRAGNKTLPALRADIRRAARALLGQLEVRPVSYTTWPMPFPSGTPLAFDIETSMDPATSGAIIRIGVSDGTTTWTAVWDTQTQAITRQLLAQPGVKIFHNKAFDEPKLLAACGLEELGGPAFCTMLAARMLQPDLFMGLNSVASLYLDTTRWKHLSDDQPELYNAWDVARTLHLYESEIVELDRSGQRELFEQTIIPGTGVLQRTSARGIKVSLPRREAWTRSLEDKVMELLFAWDTLAPGVSPRSNAKVVQLLQDAGIPRLPSSFTTSGGDSVDEFALREMLFWAEENQGSERAKEVINTLLEYRKYNKLLSTYTSYPLDDDGRVHTSFLPASKDYDPDTGKELAGTWRLTTRPNMQNQPLEARLIYIPDPGMTMLEADYAQIELRVIAYLSQDPHLIAAVNQTDVFADVCTALGIDRVRAKNGIYGTFYLGGARKLSRTFRSQGFRISVQECQEIQDGVRSRYARAWAYMNEVGENARNTYQVTNPFYLKRYFYAKKDAPPDAAATKIQSTAAIIMWKSLPLLEQALATINGQLLNFVHDSYLSQVPTGREEEGIQLMKQVLEVPWAEVNGLVVPIKVKRSTASWGEVA